MQPLLHIFENRFSTIRTLTSNVLPEIPEIGLRLHPLNTENEGIFCVQKKTLRLLQPQCFERLWNFTERKTSRVTGNRIRFPMGIIFHWIIKFHT